jgi:hypothetical protein
MRRMMAALLLMLCLTSIGYTQKGRSRTAWLNGTWEGTGYQIDTDSTWTMRLSVRGKRYRIEYPSLKCGGSWRRLSLNSRSARFREHITFGQEECVNGGQVAVERLNGKQIAYRFSHRGATDISASAILNRKK